MFTWACGIYNQEKQAINGLTGVNDMWWARVISGMHGELCVNNAYSGSRVAGEHRSAGCNMERTCGLHTGQRHPDMILVYLGINDFGFGVPLREERKRLFAKPDIRCFEPAYDCMLGRLKKNYPKATIVCGTLMRTTLRGHPDWTFPDRRRGESLDEYNRIIRDAVKKHKCDLADLCSLNQPYETLDGFHPTAQGHETIAQNWLTLLR